MSFVAASLYHKIATIPYLLSFHAWISWSNLEKLCESVASHFNTVLKFDKWVDRQMESL